MPGRRPFLLGLLLLGGAALAALLVAWRLGGDGPPALPGGWSAAEGVLEPLPPQDGGGSRFRAEGRTVLEGPAGRLVAAPGSLLELAPEAGEAGPSRLPDLLEGSLNLALARSALLDGSLLMPHGDVHLRVLPGEVQVLLGRVEAGGLLLGPGSVLLRLPGKPLTVRSRNESPAPGGEDAVPPVEAGAGAPAAEPPATLQVIDARTGSPLAGAEIRATFSEMEDGDPPFPDPGSRLRLLTDEGGRVHVPPFRPEEARLKLHLQVEHASYLPRVLVLSREADGEGRWPFATVKLRQGLTREVRLLDPEGRPLAGAALEVEEEPETERFLGEDTWEEEQSFRAGRRHVRFTGDDGSLRVAHPRVTLAMRHALLHFWDVQPRKVVLPPDLEPFLPLPVARVTLDLMPRAGVLAADEPVDLHTRPGPAGVHRLEDREGSPVAACLLEVSLEGMAPLRIYTGDDGAFTLAARPYNSFESSAPLSPDRPRRGTLTALSPLFWKAEVQCAFPSRAEIVRLEARSAALLSFRVVEDLGGGRTAPLEAGAVRISADLTLLRRAIEGEVVFAGPLPPGGKSLAVFAEGYAPRVVQLPPRTQDKVFLDLGEVRLERGGIAEVSLEAASPEVLERARLVVADAAYPEFFQDLPFGPSGRVRVGGLLEGFRYLYAVEGSRLVRSEGEVLATPQLFREGLSVPVVEAEEVEAVVEGEVSRSGSEGVLRSEDAPLHRVIERYFLEGELEPVIFTPYTLPPDGRIGSRRLLRRWPLRVEVFVVGPGGRVGLGRRARSGLEALFPLGRIALQEAPRGVFVFKVEGLGPVPPPPDVQLLGEVDRNHEVARFGRRGRALLVENLLPGRYHFLWGGGEEGGEEEVFTFEVTEGDLEVEAEVPRRPRTVEEVELSLLDPDGKPVEGAAFTVDQPGEDKSPDAESLGGGRYLLAIRTREENLFTIRAPGLLPARVVLPAGGTLPRAIHLQRGARAKAFVWDTGGRRFHGQLTLSFEPAEAEGGRGAMEARVLHGEPVTVLVEGGLLEAPGIPPGRQNITFQAAGWEAHLERVFTIGPGKINDLGQLRLDETRVLEGTVLLRGGEPAGGALVSLVRPQDAPRFPLEPAEPRRARFSARADPLGRFRIDGLPLDLTEELALTASLPGYTDAILSPVDLEAGEVVLVLDENTSLILDVGYLDTAPREGYEFRLEYLSGAPEERLDLGPLPPAPAGGTLHEGITPGLYRASWGLVEGPPGILPRAAEAWVEPGRPARLVLRVGERLVPGEARLNGTLLDDGWVLFLTDPTLPADMTVGRVKKGRFLLPVPPRTQEGRAALVPRDAFLPAFDFARGEALPREVDGLRAQLERGFLSLAYQAHHLTLDAPRGFLERNSGLEIEFPHYTPVPGGYRKELRREPVEEMPFRLRLLPPGPFSFRIAGRGGYRFLQTMDLREDTTVRLGP